MCKLCYNDNIADSIEEHGWGFWNYNYSIHVWIVLICVAVWLVLGGVCDAKRGKRLLPWGHVPAPVW